MNANPQRPDQLRLHSFLLPMLENARRTHPDLDKHTHLADLAQDAEVFDCKRLPAPFTAHTGQTAWEDAVASGQAIRLPAPVCYFELDRRFGVLAIETDAEPDGRRPIQVWPFMTFGHDEPTFSFEDWLDDDGKPVEFTWGVEVLKEKYFSMAGITRGTFWPPKDVEVDEFCTIFDGGFFMIEESKSAPDPESTAEETANIKAAYHAHVIRICKRALGVLALLDERLLTADLVPDRARYLNEKRRQKGKPPISCEHKVLTINTAAARSAARPATGTHESPRLHWRRGHWRHLATGKVWVRRCLVGDPARGFVEKDYRIEHKPKPFEALGAIAATAPEVVETASVAAPPSPEPRREDVPRPHGLLQRIGRFLSGAVARGD